MSNRMLLQCYDLRVDSDIGMHYILHIPESKAYEDPFFDIEAIINPKDILAAYSKGHTVCADVKKAQQAKPKDVWEEFAFLDNEDGTGTIKFVFYVKGDIVAVEEATIQTPVDSTLPFVENIGHTYGKLIDRMKIGGAGIVLDGLRYNIPRKVFNSPTVYQLCLLYRKKHIYIPITKTVFGGMRKMDALTISVQDTELQDIYLYSIAIENNGIIEQLWGYVLNI